MNPTLECIKYINVSRYNLQFLLDSLIYSLERRNCALEYGTPDTRKHYKEWWRLATKIEKQAIMLEDIIDNFDQIQEYLF